MDGSAFCNGRAVESRPKYGLVAGACEVPGAGGAPGLIHWRTQPCDRANLARDLVAAAQGQRLPVTLCVSGDGRGLGAHLPHDLGWNLDFAVAGFGVAVRQSGQSVCGRHALLARTCEILVGRLFGV